MTHYQLIAQNRKNLLIFAQRHGISKACAIFGVSRTTFYKLKKQFLATGSLTPKIRRKPRMPNETALNKKKMLLEIVKEHPSWGIDRYSYEFRQKGISFHRNSIWLCLKRFDLNCRYKRLIYIEALRCQAQPITERTIKAIKRSFSKIRTGLWPGHTVALDTFYAGNLKGIGRIYQITGIDLYSRYGWADIYTAADQNSAIHFTEEVLLPKLFNNGVEPESILTDNGSEFIGSRFTRMLADYGLKHYRIKPGKPILNSYCERFQRTIFEEFYQQVFRKTFFSSLDRLRNALHNYLVYYNFERPHFGLNPKGALPIYALKSKNDFIRQRFQKLLT